MAGFFHHGEYVLLLLAYECTNAPRVARTSRRYATALATLPVSRRTVSAPRTNL